MLRRIGILGGMGPEATVLLMQKVLAAVPACDDADHIPLIVDQNPQVPSRIARLIEGQGADPGPVLADMARRLAGAGAEALAMPCNTAHHYADAIRASVEIPFLDMVSLSAAHARCLAGAGGRVGVLASPAVRRIGLIDAAFAAHGLRAVFAADDAAMLAAIRRTKADGPGADARAILTAASAELRDAGAEVQMLACTEFSLMADAAAPGTICFDSLDILIAELVAFSRGFRDGTATLPAAADRSGAAPERSSTDQQGKELSKC